jgi:ABC-type multidrug transport system permease subunit
MTPKKPANPRRSVVIKVLLIYLAVALMVLFISSFIGFYLGGPEGATFALGIGLLINLLAFPIVGLRLTARLRVMAAEEAASPSPVPPMPEKQTSVRKPLKSKQPNLPRENPPA